MKESFEASSVPEDENGRSEAEPVREAGATETALILSQALLSLFEPGVLPEELAKKADYLRDAGALLASTDLTDASARKLLKESVEQAKRTA